MTDMLIEYVYNSRDNTNDLLLSADGAAYDLSAITKMELQVNSTTIDSDQSPDAFDWDTETTGKVILMLGDEGLEVGTHEAYLVLYAPDFADGIVWGSLYLKVRDI